MEINGAVVIPTDLEWYFAGRNLEVYKVSGDCLDGKKIPDHSILVIDLDMPPTIGNVTACTLEGETEPYAKMYLGPSCKGQGLHLVRTCFADPARDKSFQAIKVKGTAIACFNEDGSLLWRRPTDEEINRDYPSINTREGWARLCRESAIDHLKEQGIEPTDENITKYQRDLRQQTDEAIKELISKQAAAGTAKPKKSFNTAPMARQ